MNELPKKNIRIRTNELTASAYDIGEDTAQQKRKAHTWVDRDWTCLPKCWALLINPYHAWPTQVLLLTYYLPCLWILASPVYLRL